MVGTVPLENWTDSQAILNASMLYLFLMQTTLDNNHFKTEPVKFLQKLNP
jgi:hypothetical protein